MERGDARRELARRAIILALLGYRLQPGDTLDSFVKRAEGDLLHRLRLVKREVVEGEG